MSGIRKRIRDAKDNLIFRLFGNTFQNVLEEEYKKTGNFRKLYELMYSLHSRTYLDRPKLIELRNSAGYLKPFNTKEPLVSIRVPTYSRAKILTERTIPSFLNQTYKNIEVVIVGDHCVDDTEERMKKIKDKRVRFYNLPYRGLYPQDPVNLWRVASTLPLNEAMQMSKGLWIAPCDDDDEFLPNHIETLLKKAQKEQLEFVYGKALAINTKTGKKHREIGVFPPQHGGYSPHTAIFHHGLKFFEYDLTAWVVEEPGDWNQCRRMMQAGVRMGFVDEIVTRINYTPKHWL